jgi:drug/metabolite transporter (DMT)-like permease
MPADNLTRDRFKSALPYVALAVGILSLSMSAMFVRWAIAPGSMTGFYRLFIAALLLAPFFAGQNVKNPAVTSKNIIFPLIGGVASAFDLALWNTSLHYTSAANATLIGNTAPMWVALAGLLIFRERLKGHFWFGLILAMSGAMLIVGSDFLNHPRLGIGDLMALGSSFFYAAYYLATERGRKSLDSLSYTWLVAASAAVTLAVINIILQHPFTGYSTQTLLAFVGAGVVSQVFGYFSVSYALGHLPASLVAPTMIGQPVLTTILAIPLLGEIPYPVQIVGGVIALTGIYLVHQAHLRARSASEIAL